MTQDIWETHARWWQEEFTEGADPEYVEQIIPLAVESLAGARRVLEVGTGEGQVARAAFDGARGTNARDSAEAALVIGIDLSAAQISEAMQRGGGPLYLRSSAGALPFADESFDGVVACLVFEHIDELDKTIGELSRVLSTNGRFVLLMNHPLLQTPGSGWIDDQILEPPEQYWRIGSYLEETSTLEQVTKGVFIEFIHRPLGRYINALIEHGLVIERLIEPAPPAAFLALAPEYEQAATIPRLIVIIARKGPLVG